MRMKGKGRYLRTDLQAIKLMDKRLRTAEFSPHKKRRFPAPWGSLSESRRQSTPLIEVADGLYVAFITRTHEHYEARKMFGCLFKGDPDGTLTPLVRMDWHPSHKGLHVVVNCEDERDFKGRGLTGCKELSLDSYEVSVLDPDLEDDRGRFIEIFCEVCNVTLGQEGLF